MDEMRGREEFYEELTEDWVDIGHDHRVSWARWAPDRELNPQHADHPDVPHASLLISHRTPDGKPCLGGITPDDVPDYARSPGATWQVESEEPLTISPSILCICGDHGFITDGRWRVA